MTIRTLASFAPGTPAMAALKTAGVSNAEQQRKAGAMESPARFTEIGKDESEHRDALSAALATLDGLANTADSKR